MILHGNEGMQTQFARSMKHGCELPRVHRRASEIQGFSAAYYLIERFQGFVDMDVAVESVHLVEIYVINTQTGKAGVYGLTNMLSRKAALIRIATEREKHLSSNNNMFAGNARV